MNGFRWVFCHPEKSGVFCANTFLEDQWDVDMYFLKRFNGIFARIRIFGVIEKGVGTLNFPMSPRIYGGGLDLISGYCGGGFSLTVHSRDKDGCTPNSVPMVFIVFSRDSWGL